MPTDEPTPAMETTVAVMLGELKALQSQTLGVVQDMSERLRRVEQQNANHGAVIAAHEARIIAAEKYIQQQQEADSRERPTILSTTPIVLSLLAVGVTILLGVLTLTTK